MSKGEPTASPSKLTSSLSLESLRLSTWQVVLAITVGALMSLLAIWFGPVRPFFVTTSLALVLSWLAVVDVVRMRLPDVLTFPLIVSGLVFAVWSGLLIHCVLGAVVGYGLFKGVSFFAARLLNKPALGLGDAKLLAGFGAWLGWAALPTVLLIGSGAGIVHALFLRAKTGDESAPAPFGPALILGFWIVWTFGPFGGWPY